MPPFDLSWTPTLENKLSTQIDGQLPDFIAEDHPKFSRFLKHYYQFLEAGELRVDVNIDNILLEIETSTNLLSEDGTLVVTEIGSGSTGKFAEGETIRGGTSNATATVLVEDLGNENPRLFISSQQLFETGETITGATSGASGTVSQYRANPVQNIQQLLAYADIDNTIYDFLEEFRKSFMEGIPSNLATGIDKRNLEKHIRELYRRKGTREGAKLFMKILLDENAEVFYPNQYMLRTSDADWDKPTVLRCSTVGSSVPSEIIGQSITGQDSNATALVEDVTVFTASGGVSYIEVQISNVVGSFQVDETIYATSSVQDVRFNFIVRQINTTVSITNDGTLYQSGDAIDLDASILIGSGDVSATVGDIQTGSVSGVLVDDAGTGYEIGDLVVFTDNGNEVGFVKEAEARVTTIHGNIVDETDSDIILQEDGTNQFIELFNFQLEEGTTVSEEPYAVFGIDRTYSNTAGYYYPIYLTNYAALQTTITKSSALVNGATFASTTVALDGNAGGTIAIGMTVRGTSIGIDKTVTVTAVTSQSAITLSSAQTLLDNETLVFETTPTAVRKYEFLEYPGIIFYSPTATTAAAQVSYVSTTYTLYGGNFNHRSDQLYNESGNTASYTGSINTEAVLGDRLQSEFGVNQTSVDTNRYDNEGFMLESGSGDITKITVDKGGQGYSLLPTATVISQYGANAKVFATTQDIGRVESVNITNPGFNYSETPTTELRANFLIKDITGTFSSGAVLTNPGTGTVRSFDSTTQVLSVSLEDTIAIEGEQNGNTPTEGVRLEDSLVDQSYVDVNLISDADLVYGENLVDADGDRILIDAIAARTDFILLEDGFGELVMEFAETRGSFFDIESGTGDAGVVITEDYDYIVSEDEENELPFEYDTRQIKFVQETSSPDTTKINVGDFVVLDADLVYEEDLVLDASAADVDVGEKILFNATDANGTDDPSNLIVMEVGTGSGVDVNNELLQEVEPFVNLVLDGTNSSGFHETEKILFEDAGADYLSTSTTISTATASATIIDVDVAKASFELGTTIEKTGSFSGIESLIGEELVRIQDSFYYQQFSYEIQTNASGNSYLNELKKAVHPAGFNVFSKVIQTSSVSMAITTTGASLDRNDYDINTYSAILASTFTTLFDETIQRRLGIQTEEDDDILLESSIVQRDGDKFTLEDETGVGFLQLQTPENAYPDFEAISIVHGTDAGEFGILFTEDLDRIVSEQAEEISNNLVLDGTEDGHLPQSQDDAGSDILLDGTDSDSTDAGDSLEVEDSLQDGISFILGEDTSVVDNLLDETEGEAFVYDGNAELNADVFLRQNITTKVTATVDIGTPNGFEFLTTTSIKGITGDAIELEIGTSQKGSRLLITGTADLSSEGNPQADHGDNFLLEDSLDVNVGQSVTLNTFTTIANDNFVDETDGDNLILENSVGFQGGGAILGEDFNPDSYNINDIVREPMIFFPNENDGKENDAIILEGQEVGIFKQEDGSTVIGTFGDDIILEDYTGFGVGVKLSLETTPIISEEDEGALPLNVRESTILDPLVHPSDIFVNEIGKLTHEDDYDFIVFDTVADENDQIILESGTDFNIYIQSIANSVITASGFSSGTFSFDGGETFDT